MSAFYLTNQAAEGVSLELLPPFYLNEDTEDASLADAGWHYARFMNTGARVLVRSKRNRRWLAAWSECVTDFEVHHVDTVVDSGGVIRTAKGEPHDLKLYALADRVESI
jgi:hypothetical protein